jgi:hypothetical protein
LIRVGDLRTGSSGPHVADDENAARGMMMVRMSSTVFWTAVVLGLIALLMIAQFGPVALGAPEPAAFDLE